MRPTRQVAQDMGCAYMYDTIERVNLRADKLAIGDTLIAELLPSGGTIDTTFTPLVRESRDTTFLFLTHCDLDFKGRDVGEIIDEMLDLAKRFIVRLDALGIYEPQDVVRQWSPYINRLDANMAGVALSLTLKELQGDCVNG